MRRRLVQQGAKSLFVSLPASWIKSQSLLKGAEVNLQIEDSQIIITSPQTAQKKLNEFTKTLSPTDSEKTIRSYFDNFNRNGFDVWNIQVASSELRSKIKSVIRKYFFGIQITYEEKNFLTVQNISSDKPLLLDSVLNRMLFIIGELFENISDSKSCDNLSDDIFATKSYAQRIVNSLGDKSNYYGTYISRIYQIASPLRSISKDDSIDFTEILADIKSFFDLYKTNHLKKDSSNAEKIEQMYTSLQEKLFLIENPANLRQFWFVGSVLRNIYLSHMSLMTVISEGGLHES